MCEFLDMLVDFFRLVGNNEQRRAFITEVEHLYHLCGGKLKDDGIKRLIPAKQKPRDRKHDGVTYQDIVPCVHIELVGQRDRDEISASARSAAHQAKADGKAVNQPAEMQTSKTSFVSGIAGMTSVSVLVRTIIRQEYNVNRFPISLKLISAGTALSRKLISENGRDKCKNCCALRWISSVSH